jgi:hypothetical protein
VPIAGAWGPFVPELPEAERRDYFYPVPLSDAFWHRFAEPVAASLEAAIRLSKML